MTEIVIQSDIRVFFFIYIYKKNLFMDFFSGEKKQERFLQLYSKAPHYEEMRTEVKNMQEKLIKVEQVSC